MNLQNAVGAYANTKAREQSKLLRHAQRAGFYVLLGIIVIFTLFPFYWAFNSSFKSEQELFEPASYVPRNLDFQNAFAYLAIEKYLEIVSLTPEVRFSDALERLFINYRAVLSNDAFIRALGNSSLVSGITVTLALVVGAFAAYALGRLDFRGRKIMMYLVLSMTMFPQISILSGLFSIVSEAGVYGSPLSMIMTYPIFTLPFTVWVLTSFFQGLPDEIEQAAYVDGATSFQTFYLIMLPLTAPALVTTGLLAFIAAWNEYLYALTFTLTAPDSQTVPVAIALFSGEIARQEPIAEVMAASMIVTFPLLVLVFAFQNRIMAGLTAGAVKG